MAAVVATALMLGATPALGAETEVLMLGSTVSGGDTSIEANAVKAAGFTPVVVSDAEWEAKTSADFASYRGLVLGDPTCTDSKFTAAETTTRTWGPQVDGNVVLVGTDPVYHADQGGDALTERGIAYALADGERTGAYITLSCSYHDTPENTSVPLLDGIHEDGFTVRGVGCFNDSHITATHQALDGLTDAALSDWSCSVHEAFDKYPSDFLVLAIAENIGSTYVAPDGTFGTPYILARGRGSSYLARSMVAIGDSVSAGEGIAQGWEWHPGTEDWTGEWEQTGPRSDWDTTYTDEGCHQTPQAHPRVAAGMVHADLLHLSCTGSTAFSGVFGKHHEVGAAAQLGSDALSSTNARYDGAKPDIVTLSLGANDVGFAGVVRGCVTGRCDTDDSRLDGALKTQKDDLRLVLGEIESRGKAAGKVPMTILTKYVDPFPAVYQDRCPDLNVPVAGFAITNDEMQFMRRGLRRLNQNLEDVAAAFDFVRVLDPPSSFTNHPFCSREPWTMGVGLIFDGAPDFSNPSPFHPTADGQTVIGRAVAKAIEAKLPLRTGTGATTRYPDGTRLTFDSVTTAGSVSVEELSVDDAPATSSFSPSKIWEIGTTAIFDGGAELTLPGKVGEAIYHYVGGAWTPLSTVFDNGLLKARTSSFSPFAVGTPVGEVAARVTGGTEGIAPHATSFSAGDSTVEAPGAIESVEWSFGDGTTATGMQVNHVFRLSGTYTVTATVRSTEGATDTATRSVTITNATPAAVVDAPATAKPGQEVTFDGSRSSDPNGKITSYEWKVSGDDKALVGASIKRTFQSPGEYRVTLEVADDEGRPATATHTVVVKEATAAPVAPETPSGGGDKRPVPSDGATRPGSAVLGDTQRQPAGGKDAVKAPQPVLPRASLAKVSIKGRRLSVRVSCLQQRCRGRVVLVVGGKVVATAKLDLSKGAKRMVKLRLKRRLKTKARLEVRLEGSSQPAAAAKVVPPRKRR